MSSQPVKVVEFERPQMDSGSSCTAQAWARVPATPSAEERAALKQRIKALLKEKRGGTGRALLRRCRPAGPGRGNRRLRLRFARNGALRPRPPGQDAGGGRRALHGRDRQDPEPGKDRADARPGRHLLARSGLPGRRVRRLLRRPSRPHGGGLREHQRGGQGARRLDGDFLDRSEDRRPPACAGQEDPVGAGQAPGRLHPEADRRRHAAVAGLLPGARRVQGASSWSC